MYKVRTTVSAEMQDFWQMEPVSMADLATAAQSASHFAPLDERDKLGAPPREWRGSVRFLGTTPRGLNAGAGVGRLGGRVRAWEDVMRVLLAVLLITIAGCGGDPNKKANELFVESVQLINSAENKTGDAAIADYEQALANVQQIIDKYGESDLAVKLVSGETLFSNASLSDIRARLGELHEEKEAMQAGPATKDDPPYDEKHNYDDDPKPSG